MWCKYCQDNFKNDGVHLVSDSVLGWVHNPANDPDASPNNWHTIGGTRVVKLKVPQEDRLFSLYIDKSERGKIPGAAALRETRLDKRDVD
jgi:hypothetical protein